MFESESWARCPVAAAYSVDDIKEFSNCISGPLSASQQIMKPGAESRFTTIRNKGNPFNKMIQYQKKKVAPSPTKGAEGDSDEDEPEELRADFVEEDSEAQVQPKRAFVNENKGPLVATITVNTIRLLGKYIHLLHVLSSSVGVEVFVAIVQIVEYFIHTIYTFFGSPPPGSGVSLDDLSAFMTPSLRKTLARLRDRINPSLISAVDAKTTSGNTTIYDLVKIKWVSARLSPALNAELSQQKNHYGLGMRTVGVESLLFLLEALNKSRNVLYTLVPQTASEFFNSFYAQVGLIPELRMHMYKAATAPFFATDFAKAVDNIKWDTPQVLFLYQSALLTRPQGENGIQ